MTDKRICPAARCSAYTLPGRFMCRAHWFGLPKPLRDEVWRSWRLIQGHRRSAKTPELKIGDIRDYRAACDAATAYWAGRP